jgi:mannosyltransferase OCH1-like enzyme
VIDSLTAYNRNWQIPYITVMYSTGPLFLSVIWKQYMASEAAKAKDGMGRVRILLPDEYNKHHWSFFSHHRGNSWHGKDAKMIFWMARHWMLLTALGFALAGCVGLCFWWVYGKVLLGLERRGHRGIGVGIGKRRIPFWRRVGIKDQYELVERDHEV